MILKQKGSASVATMIIAGVVAFAASMTYPSDHSDCHKNSDNQCKVEQNK